MTSGPYSYELVGSDAGASEPGSLFTARITPPFEVGTYRELYEKHERGFMEVHHYATTALATVIKIDVDLNEPNSRSHEDRVQQTEAFLDGLIGELNAINDIASDEWAKDYKLEESK